MISISISFSIFPFGLPYDITRMLQQVQRPASTTHTNSRTEHKRNLHSISIRYMWSFVFAMYTHKHESRFRIHRSTFVYTLQLRLWLGRLWSPMVVWSVDADAVIRNGCFRVCVYIVLWWSVSPIWGSRLLYRYSDMNAMPQSGDCCSVYSISWIIRRPADECRIFIHVHKNSAELLRSRGEYNASGRQQVRKYYYALGRRPAGNNRPRMHNMFTHLQTQTYADIQST